MNGILTYIIVKKSYRSKILNQQVIKYFLPDVLQIHLLFVQISELPKKKNDSKDK